MKVEIKRDSIYSKSFPQVTVILELDIKPQDKHRTFRAIRQAYKPANIEIKEIKKPRLA